MPKAKGKQPIGRPANGDKNPETLNPATELRELLLLGNNLPIFEEIRNNIRLVAKEHLDVNKTVYPQKAALGSIRKELVERYPDLFDVEDGSRRLDLAENMIKIQHNAARYCAKKKLKKENEIPGSTKRASGRLGARPELSSHPVKEKTSNAGDHRQQWDFIEPTNFSEPSSSFRSDSLSSVNGRMPATPLARRAATPGLSSSSRSVRKGFPSTPRSVTFTTPLATSDDRPGVLNNGYESSDSDQPLAVAQRRSRSVPPPARMSNRNLSRARGQAEATDSVYHFLDTCVPSMAHLFEAFVEYGCEDEEFLLGVSDWPPELISNFVKKVAANCRQHISKMEIDVLQAHFLTYFKV